MSRDYELQEYRKQLNLTQRELARLAGVSQSHVSKVESGIRGPSRKLQKFLDNSAAHAKAAIIGSLKKK